MASHHACVLIPVYNHERAIVDTCRQLKALALPIILVDDGSSPACASVLDQLATQPNIHLVRLIRNSGKGAAVRTGLFAARDLGFTHALQVDADGQHDVEDLPAFIADMDRTPEALIIGRPRFDDTVPMHRFICRYITHVWVWVNTLSMTITDSMCGVRLYPVAPLTQLLSRYSCGDRMDFDTEVLVRWYWSGQNIQNRLVRVHYPTDGVSHFRLLRDNLILARMHVRLTLGMLIRMPSLLARRRAS